MGERIGIDFGGSKIEGVRLNPAGEVAARRRVPNPGGYDQALAAVAELVRALEAGREGACSVGVGAPGSPSPRDGLMRGANSVWLNGRPFRADLEAALRRPVRLANDANCFALSEVVDGAAAGAASAFGVIVGTGCGGGVVLGGRLVEGANGVAGEWGHTPLPWMSEDERAAGLVCWCGRLDCLERWVSGPGLEADHRRRTGVSLSAPEIAAGAEAGEATCRETLARHADRLGRGLAMVCDVIDPEVIVLGGGVSNIAAIYPAAQAALERWLFSDVCVTRIVRARHGDSSGVRGAAWLWD